MWSHACMHLCICKDMHACLDTLSSPACSRILPVEWRGPASHCQHWALSVSFTPPAAPEATPSLLCPPVPLGIILAEGARYHSLTRYQSCRRSDSGLRLFTTPEDRTLLLCLLLHCADIGNPLRPAPIARKWAGRVLDEFFRQASLGGRVGGVGEWWVDGAVWAVRGCQGCGSSGGAAVVALH